MTLVPDYTPTDWVDHVTPVDEAHMDPIDQALDAHANAINALDGRLAPVESQADIPAVVNGQWLKGLGGALVFSPIAISDVTSLGGVLTGKQDTSGKGVANGYASLDSAGKVPVGQLPVSIDLRWAGTYSAATAYKEGDVVVKDGISYMALRPSTGEAPVPWATGGGGAISYQTAALSSDVVVPNKSWVDALTVSLAAGTWLVIAQCGIQQSSGGSGTVSARIWDGTITLIEVESPNLGSSDFFSCVLSRVITLGADGSIRLAGYNTRSGGNFRAQTSDQPLGAGTANNITALRLA